MRAPARGRASTSFPASGIAIDAQLTRIAVLRAGPGHQTVLTSGLLRPQVVRSRPDWCRIGLLATTALLLGGDHVELDVDVGEGARLDLFDVAGTVAYSGRGLPAGWSVRIRVAAGGVLRMGGLPFVVADGARVTRRFELNLAGNASAALRDTVVLGRSGEQGGWLRNVTAVRRDGELVLLEDLELDPTSRRLPGMLGNYRVLDTVTLLGQQSAAARVRLDGASCFRLAGDDSGELWRYCGYELADSPVNAQWDRLTDEPIPSQEMT